jgi:hypothetical protein
MCLHEESTAPDQGTDAYLLVMGQKELSEWVDLSSIALDAITYSRVREFRRLKKSHFHR